MAWKSGEPVPPSAPRDVLDRFVAAYHARDWRALRDMLSPDLQALDRRPLGWGSLEGPEAYMKLIEGGVELAPDARLAVAPIVLGARAGVFRWMGRGHLAEGGGEYELEFVTLNVAKEGLVTHIEYFEPADAQRAVARFEEIGAQTEPERVLARLSQAVLSRDWGAIEDLYAEDFELTDHRVLGWEPMRSGRAVADFFRSWVALVPDVENRFTVLAGDDEHAVAQLTGWGHAAEGGGEMENPAIVTFSLSDGRIRRNQIFEVGDEALALAWFEERRAGRR